jgi:hypothetical protein
MTSPLQEWLKQAELVLPTCLNPEIFKERIEEQKKRQLESKND